MKAVLIAGIGAIILGLVLALTPEPVTTGTGLLLIILGFAVFGVKG